MTNEDHINKSKYSFRLKQIDSTYTSIINSPYYHLSTYEINNITLLFSKQPPSILDIRNFVHIWYLLGPNIRLKIEHFNLLKNVINNINYWLNSAFQKYGEVLDNNNILTSKSTEIVCNKECIDRLKLDYLNFIEIYEQININLDEFHRLINTFKFICKDNSINNLNNDYKLKICNEWIYTLVYIYEKYNGQYPTNCISLFNHLKNMYPNMIDCHANELVDIIDYNLGGKSISNIHFIAKNFEVWIRRNYDSVNDKMRQNIILT